MLFGKRINKYYLKYLAFFLIAIVTLIWVDFEQVKIPEYLGQVIALFKNGAVVKVEDVMPIVFKTLIVAVHLFCGRIIWRYTLFYASKKIECSLRHEMFLKAEELPIEYYRQNKVGTVMAWFTSDLETIEEFLGWGTVMMVDAIVLAGIVIIKMLILKWQIAILCFIPLALIVFWAGFVEKIVSERWKTRQAYNDELYDFSDEAFAGIRVIKAFVKENKQVHAFAKIAKKNQDFNYKFARLIVMNDVVIQLIIGLVISLILGIGGYFAYLTVTHNTGMLFGKPITVEIDELITFMGYFETLVWPLIAMGQVTTMHSRAKASLSRITAFLNTESVVKSKENAIVLDKVSGSISFKNFSFAFPDGNESCLKNISVDIKAGERIGIVGKIGSGKSALVNVLLRLYNVMDNSVFIDGIDLMNCEIDSLRSCIAYVPQDNFLFSDTIKNNIGFSDESSSLEDIRKVAKFASVDEDIMNFKQGYETISGERGVTLSGGQKQRISIARALLKDPPILILDDSVSAVDVKTEEEILHNIAELRKGKTTLVVASRISTVQHLDKIIVLKDGCLEAFDTPERLSKECETYKKMVYLQKLEEEIMR